MLKSLIHPEPDPEPGNPEIALISSITVNRRNVFIKPLYEESEVRKPPLGAATLLGIDALIDFGDTGGLDRVRTVFLSKIQQKQT